MAAKARFLKLPYNPFLRWGLYVLAMTVVAGLLAIAYYTYTVITEPHALIDDVGDSKYTNIKSHYIYEEDKKKKVTIEYPETNNDTVNKVIRDTVETTRKDFTGDLTEVQNSERVELAISYQIPYQDDTYVSVVLYTKQDSNDPKAISFTNYWTFNVKDGSIVQTEKLFKGAADKEALVAAVRNKAVEQLNYGNETALVSEDVNQTITPESISNFTITDKLYITFPFGRGEIVDPKYGEVSVQLPAKQFQSTLEPTLAKQIFAIETQLPQPPQKVGGCPKNCVALTFDDGPSQYTPQLLDYLAQGKARGTFFLVGQAVEKYPSIAQRQVHEGHEVGNHSYNHPELTRISAVSVNQQLVDTNTSLKKFINNPVTLMRPPYGSVNQAVYSSSAQNGLAVIMWSLDTRDWADKNSTIVCNRATTGVTSGSIILMHDVHKTTVDAMPCITKKLIEMGYQMVTVSELLGKTTPGKPYYHGN